MWQSSEPGEASQDRSVVSLFFADALKYLRVAPPSSLPEPIIIQFEARKGSEKLTHHLFSFTSNFTALWPCSPHPPESRNFPHPNGATLVAVQYRILTFPAASLDSRGQQA